MVRLERMIAASRVVIDKASNKLSLFDVIEDTISNKFPFSFPTTSLVVFLTRESLDDSQVGELEFSVKVDKKYVLKDQKVIFDFEESLLNRTTLNIQGLTIEKPCKVIMSVKFNKKIYKYTFNTMEITSN